MDPSSSSSSSSSSEQQHSSSPSRQVALQKNSGKKGSNGRKKIPIQKIESKNALQVTFSKRRQGLFKKALELSVLCGAQVFVLAFSPAGKPFPFSSSPFDHVPPPSPLAACDDVVLLQRQFVQLQQKQEMQKQRRPWWEERRIEEMEVDELKDFLGGLKKEVEMRQDEIWLENLLD